MMYPFLTLDDSTEIVHSEMRDDNMISCIWGVTAAYRSRSLFCIPKPRSASNLQIKPLCESDRIGAVSVSL